MNLYNPLLDCPDTINQAANIANSDIEDVTEIVTAKPAISSTGHRDLNDLEKETSDLGSSSNLTTVVSEKDSKSKTYVHKCTLTCLFMFERLNYYNLNSIDCTLDQTKKKISYATYIERKKETEKAQPNKPVDKKHPILTAHLTNSRKTPTGQTDPVDHNTSSLRSPSVSTSSSKLPNNSIKRSSNSDNGQQAKRKCALSDAIREMFQAMARDMEAEASVHRDDDVLDGQDAANWCVTKASNILDKYRNKGSPIQGHTNPKSKH